MSPVKWGHHYRRHTMHAIAIFFVVVTIVVGGETAAPVEPSTEPTIAVGIRG